MPQRHTQPPKGTTAKRTSKATTNAPRNARLTSRPVSRPTLKAAAAPMVDAMNASRAMPVIHDGVTPSMLAHVAAAAPMVAPVGAPLLDVAPPVLPENVPPVTARVLAQMASTTSRLPVMDPARISSVIARFRCSPAEEEFFRDGEKLSHDKPDNFADMKGDTASSVWQQLRSWLRGARQA